MKYRKKPVVIKVKEVEQNDISCIYELCNACSDMWAYWDYNKRQMLVNIRDYWSDCNVGTFAT